MSVEALLRQMEQSYGVDRQGPVVSFYDHAVPANKAASDYLGTGKFKITDGRPRFKPAVFVKMTTQNDPTGSNFTTPVTEEHKEMYPKEWELYCKLKERVGVRLPPIEAIPNMDAVALHELKSLGIRDCRQLIEYEGDLDSIEHLRNTAKQIMEIADVSSRDIHQKREKVPQGVERPVYGTQGRDDWDGTDEKPQKATKLPYAVAKPEVEFDYEFAA